MRTAISSGDLDLLTGEVLPERTVLSTLVPPFFSGSDADADAGADAGAGAASGSEAVANNYGSGGATVLSSCVNQQQAGNNGLVGLIAPTPPSSSQLCTPAAIAG